jgi:hypothetical protein
MDAFQVAGWSQHEADARFTLDRTVPCEAVVSISHRIAGILGPSLVAVIASEFPLVQPDLYAQQVPPVVYLSGVLMFVAGLAIVRAHNVWVRNWAVLVTLCGWMLLGLGAVRMFAASTYQRASAAAASWVLMVLEGVLFFVGLYLTFKAYGSKRSV